MAKGFLASDYRYAPSAVRFSIDDADLQRVYDRCEALCLENIRQFGCRKVIQEGAKYHGVWLETQPMGGEMYAKRNMEVALNNQLIFMEYQRRDGRMPGMITYDLPWNGLSVRMDWMQGDFFTIPAMRMYYHIGKDPEYLKKLYAALRDFDDYLWTYRDSDGNGCLEVWCTWDTGDDNNTRYLANRIHAKDNGCWDGEEAPYGVGGLPLESAEYMAYSYAQRSTLAKLSELLGNGEAEMWKEKAEAVRSRFMEYMWDDDQKYAFDRDCQNEKIECLSLANIKCMFQGIFTQEMADDFIRLHLMNPEEFFTYVPLPNIAANDPLFYLNREQNNLGDRLESVLQYSAGDIDDNSWSGPAPGLCHQRVLPALLRYGHHAEAALIGRRWIENQARTDRYPQQYNPFTGAPAPGDDGYGPTILASLEYFAHFYGIAIEEDRALWSALSDSPAFAYTQEMYNSTFTQRYDGKEVVAEIDGAEVFRFTAGVRVLTSLDGTPERVFGMSTEPIEVRLTVGNKILTAAVAPNEELEVQGDKLVSVRRVHFSMPETK